ncbi:MAG: UbiA family prenyltransferase [Nitrosomonadales bacterium]
MVTFVAFCLVSSGVYVFNDIVDLEQDRQHPKKCLRPLAAGQVGDTRCGFAGGATRFVRFRAGLCCID